ncbi:hypothetical protein [Egibacter rhizosphaerae]|uniref:hypothetical protein n=1 Tax=Egibacter rhizosphaerae TaxID=1670831 RepID=UPI00197AD8CD|nr:hypothetical protein [Egibacter rhizosphaerae]
MLAQAGLGTAGLQFVGDGRGAADPSTLTVWACSNVDASVGVCAAERGRHGTSMHPNDAPTNPVRDADIEAFAAAFTDGLDGLHGDEPAPLVIAADRSDDFLDVALLDPDRTEVVAAIDQVTSGARRILGTASRVAWSPTPDGASSPAWLVVVVGVARPVFAAVRCDQDTRWQLLTPDQLPWFALSTAAGLRGAVERGEPLRLKVGSDPGLFRRPDEGEPPVDEHGSL